MLVKGTKFNIKSKQVKKLVLEVEPKPEPKPEQKKEYQIKRNSIETIEFLKLLTKRNMDSLL
jgi:sporulation protein YlmC with PRC-barrel domain